MSCLYFYKLVSEFPCDTTKNCNLTIGEIDNNFYQLKSDDISGSTYDKENMILSLVKNNGDEIRIDLSELSDDIIAKLGFDDGFKIEGEITDDGALVLTWPTADGEGVEVIRGLLSQIIHDTTLSGTGSDKKPLRISENERTAKYKAVKGIVQTLPQSDRVIGDRYITKERVSSFGRLYSKQGLEMVKDALTKEESVWKVPTKEDWDKFLNYVEGCGEDLHGGGEIGEYMGIFAGKFLKSVDYWEGNENLDSYGYSVVPAGYVNDYLFEGADYEARLWSDTAISGRTNSNYIKGFSYDHDNVLQDASEDGGFYSIRLVRPIDNSFVGPTQNILGVSYKVVNVLGTKQAWIVTNLVYNPGDSYSQEYTYQHEGIISERYVINHWNGRFWEKKELEEGDEVTVANDNNLTTFTCMTRNGEQELVKGLTYRIQDGVRSLILDAGWY